MLGRPDVRPWWVCLPPNLRNASSLEEPYWCCWEPGAEADWVRPLPKHPGVISDPGSFPSTATAWNSEEFVAGFNAWLAREEPTAFLVGIRSDESLQPLPGGQAQEPGETVRLDAAGRLRAAGLERTRPGQPAGGELLPIYDWRFEDLWRCVADHGYAYNRLYDQMHRAGVPSSQMRICQPYGDDQRKGLDLFHRIEPRTWFRVVRRVAGANYGARYCRQRFSATAGGLGLPPSFGTWREYSQFLLRSMPPPLRGILPAAHRAFSSCVEAARLSPCHLAGRVDPGPENRRKAAVLAAYRAVPAEAGHWPARCPSASPRPISTDWSPAGEKPS